MTTSLDHEAADDAALSPAAFFERVLPQAFEGETGEVEPEEEIRLHYHVTGSAGGDWLVHIVGDTMTVGRHAGPALVRYSLSAQDASDAINSANGASPILIIPRPPERSRGRSGAIRALRGTLVLRLERAWGDPFHLEICFNDAERPRTLLEMALPDYIAMQERRLGAQEAYANGKMRVDGDMPFLMQVGMATST